MRAHVARRSLVTLNADFRTCHPAGSGAAPGRILDAEVPDHSGRVARRRARRWLAPPGCHQDPKQMTSPSATRRPLVVPGCARSSRRSRQRVREYRSAWIGAARCRSRRTPHRTPWRERRRVNRSNQASGKPRPRSAGARGRARAALHEHLRLSDSRLQRHRGLFRFRTQGLISRVACCWWGCQPLGDQLLGGRRADRPPRWSWQRDPDTWR